jgi:hypothetical protein
MKIILKTIHIIDYEIREVILRETPETFKTYVAELTSHISSNDSVRKYKTRTNSTEVIGSVLMICSKADIADIVASKMEGIAKRLLLKEIEAQEQIARTRTNVQKGSLIQALLMDESDSYIYLLAKVEHSDWVDDSDFSFKTGFSKDKKTIWKSCLIDLPDLNGIEFDAKIYSNTIAKYWCDGFLEFDEMNSNESNTAYAFKAIEATLNQNFKGTSSPDHTVIRNCFIGYFKNTEHIDYPKMVNSILENYQPIDPEFMTQDKIASIQKKLLEQPQKRNFDRQFSSVNSVINARIRRVYPITEGVDLKVNQGIEDLRGTIQSVEENGVKYIRVRATNDATYKKFQTIHGATSR